MKHVAKRYVCGIAAVGAVIIGGTPEQFGDYLKSEIAKFARVVKEAKITAQ